LHNSSNLKNQINSLDKEIESNKEDILTSSVKENIQVILNNKNVFKIVVIIIACLNKLYQSGNFD